MNNIEQGQIVAEAAQTILDNSAPKAIINALKVAMGKIASGDLCFNSIAALLKLGKRKQLNQVVKCIHLANGIIAPRLQTIANLINETSSLFEATLDTDSEDHSSILRVYVKTEKMEFIPTFQHYSGRTYASNRQPCKWILEQLRAGNW
jgi:hypothetical protein